MIGLRYFWDIGPRSTVQDIYCRLSSWSAFTLASKEKSDLDPFCDGDPCDADADPQLCMQEHFDMDGDDDNEEPNILNRDANLLKK